MRTNGDPEDSVCYAGGHMREQWSSAFSGGIETVLTGRPEGLKDQWGWMLLGYPREGP